MDVRYRLYDTDFEWDSNKAVSNLIKHRVSFERACEVFFDPFCRLVKVEMVNGEERESLIGMTVNWKLLYVVYVMKDETIRIISARPVTKHERREYEEY